VDIVAHGGHPAIRAVSPVVDENFDVLGSVSVTVPLDHRFADVLRATLGVHVGFYLRDEPVASSFQSQRGRAQKGVSLPERFRERVVAGEGRVTMAEWQGQHYAVGALPLVNSLGKPVGLFYVALNRQAQEAGKLESYRSLLLGGALVFLLAFLIATLAAQGLARPLTKLHQRAMSVARGNLEDRIGLEPGDELGDLGQAFDDMIGSLRDNQQRLAARISEIVTLHNISRAVSSVVELDDVLRTVVEEIRRALGAERMVVLLTDEQGRLQPRARVGFDTEEPVALPPGTPPTAGGVGGGSANAGPPEPEGRPGEGAAPAAPRAGAAPEADPASLGEAAAAEGPPGTDAGDDEAKAASPNPVVMELGREALADWKTLCIDRITEHPEYGEAAEREALRGSVMVVPLQHKERIQGVLLVNREPPEAPFGEAELRLLSTFADQASTAIENARLYEEVTRFNERLEQMVDERTAELSRANRELAQALQDLQEAQSQLILSERLAGLGQLVAGIAHEVNTPAAAIQGAADNVERGIARLLDYARQLANLRLSVDQWNAFMDEVATHAQRGALSPPQSPTAARQQSQELAEHLEQKGVPDARRLARRLVDLGAADSAARLLALTGPQDVQALVGCLQELVLLQRNGLAITTAIGTINRIVTALRAYSHLDQTRVDRMNLHDGIETTLVILASRLKHDVTVTKRYADLPPVPVYVDELNQVWTNLIVNAADASEPGGEIVIESEVAGDEVAVRIIDGGPGIPPEVQPRIFKPFFTTKAKGQGTGLGLGICQRIVEKHGGRIEATSEPGRTVFEVFLPIAGPPGYTGDGAQTWPGSAASSGERPSGDAAGASPHGEAGPDEPDERAGDPSSVDVSSEGEGS
jgi:signal transduction histidine kinase